MSPSPGTACPWCGSEKEPRRCRPPSDLLLARMCAWPGPADASGRERGLEWPPGQLVPGGGGEGRAGSPLRRDSGEGCWEPCSASPTGGERLAVLHTQSRDLRVQPPGPCRICPAPPRGAGWPDAVLGALALSACPGAVSAPGVSPPLSRPQFPLQENRIHSSRHWEHPQCLGTLPAVLFSCNLTACLILQENDEASGESGLPELRGRPTARGRWPLGLPESTLYSEVAGS